MRNTRSFTLLTHFLSFLLVLIVLLPNVASAHGDKLAPRHLHHAKEWLCAFLMKKHPHTPLPPFCKRPQPPAPKGEISGMLYEDMIGNGTMDPEVDGFLIGWTVKLTGPVERTATTGEFGRYAFTGLQAGTYVVEPQFPEGWVATTAPLTVSLTEGAAVPDVMFGNFKTVSMSGKVWHDTNRNSALDPGEAGLSGWTAFADGAPDFNNYPGQFERSAVSDANGDYLITGIGPGTYRICELMQPGWVQVYPMSLPPADACYSILTFSGINGSGSDFGNDSE